MSVTGTPLPMPAEWTSPPMVPTSVSERLAAALSVAVRVTSTLMPTARTPNSSMHRCATRRAAAPSRSHSATARPTWANASAVASPMPDPPPVTTTPESGEEGPPLWVRRRTARGARRAPGAEVGVPVRARGEVRGRLLEGGAVGPLRSTGAIVGSPSGFGGPGAGAGNAPGALLERTDR